MKPYLALALKSIKSNKQSSIITIVLSALSTAILVFSMAFMDGQHKIFLQNAVELYPGYVQVTHRDFRDNPSYENLIIDANQAIHKIKQLESVSKVVKRFETFVLLSSDKKSVGVMLGVINPEDEKKISRLEKSLLKGRYLYPSDTNAIYIGNELAQNIGVNIGDELTFIGTGADYSFVAEKVVVVGIFQTGSFDFDNTSIFVNQTYFEPIFASENMATHLVVLPKDTQLAQPLSQHIQALLNSNFSTQSWQMFMQSLVQAMEIDAVFSYVVLFIIFVVIFFVIMIYTLLNVFARIREIGVLRALGTTRYQVLNMLLLESILLAFMSVVIGGLIGAALAYYFSLNPIELGQEFEQQFKQYNLVVTSIPADFNLKNILMAMLVMFILCVSATLYPVLKVNRYQIIESIRHV